MRVIKISKRDLLMALSIINKEVDEAIEGLDIPAESKATCMGIPVRIYAECMGYIIPVDEDNPLVLEFESLKEKEE